MRIIINIFLSFLILTSISHGAERIQLVWADSVLGSMTVGSRHRNFQGNVQFRQGDVKVYCDNAIQYIEENRLQLRGNVKIIQNTLTLTAPEIHYNGNTYIADALNGVEIKDKKTTLTAQQGDYSTQTYIANFYGNVRIDDDSVTILSDVIKHSRVSRNSFATGNVTVKGKHTNAILTGDTVNHFPNEHYTIASGDPILIQIDTNQSNTNKFDTLYVSSRVMESYRFPGDESYEFTDDVEIIRGYVSARADFTRFSKTKENMELYGKPIVWYGDTQLHSDSIRISLPNNKLSVIKANGNALTCSKESHIYQNRINQIIGNQIEIKFKNEEIDKIISVGEAMSLYFLFDGSLPDGASRSGADTIKIFFAGGEVDEILWLGSIPGNVYPENSIQNSPQQYYLPGFRWSVKKPKKREK